VYYIKLTTLSFSVHVKLLHRIVSSFTLYFVTNPPHRTLLVSTPFTDYTVPLILCAHCFFFVFKFFVNCCSCRIQWFTLTQRYTSQL